MLIVHGLQFSVNSNRNPVLNFVPLELRASVPLELCAYLIPSSDEEFF
jgi:hypothetical protein